MKNEFHLPPLNVPKASSQLKGRIINDYIKAVSARKGGVSGQLSLLLTTVLHQARYNPLGLGVSLAGFFVCLTLGAYAYHHYVIAPDMALVAAEELSLLIGYDGV